MRAGRLKNRTNLHATTGSALILTVVLTSLLAIVGVLFVMVTRIDKMGTEAVSQNRELTFAAETVVAEISELLAQDVPGISGTEEYYDFPDAVNAWLADLEPYQDANGVEDYRWRQISSIAGVADARKRNVRIRVIGERDPIVDVVDVNEAVTNADADGDGVGDAQWFEVPGIMSSKGRPIYAAVRIIDNGGMLNVNTGYWFDPNRDDPSFSDPSRTDASPVDGSSPLQINAVALAGGHVANSAANDSYAKALLEARRVDPTAGWSGYEDWVLWRYLKADPCSPYTPFDLSDELELRYRGLINHGRVDTRVETWGRFKGNTISTPVDYAGADLDNWFARARDAGELDSRYAYRHVATTYNMDRIIWPRYGVGPSATLRKMVNVNSADKNVIYDAINWALQKTGRDPVIIKADAAQITANLVDYIDDDDEVTAIDGASASGARYHGFERPCVYISEIAHNAVTDGTGAVHHSYAVELHKPHFEDRDPATDQWRLVIKTAGADDVVQPIEWLGLRRFHVLLLEVPLAELFDNSAFSDPEEPADAPTRYSYQRSYSNPTAQIVDALRFGEGATFDLQRLVSRTGEWLTVDFVRAPRDGWMTPDQGPHSVQRDISLNKCIRKLWTPTAVTPIVLGHGTGQYADPNDEGVIQAHPINRTLRNIGELGMVFANSGYGVMPIDIAAEVLLDLMDPAYAELFNYLTVLDPTEHIPPPAPDLPPNPNETRIMGRININTAPWFVLAQLPWIQYQDISDAKSIRAQAIVDYRDTYGPFENTAGLMQVTALHDLADDDRDNLNDDVPDRGPDLTRDSARDDLEERDLLFTRMSNLVTVRSDVFTAYILVRLGATGPQKRMMAIFDRSETSTVNPAVRIVALHPVSDPR
jgi:hypothetical protein